MDTTRINHNNSGHKYRIAVDIAKEGSHIWDLTPYVKGRVGDNNFGLQVTWYYQGQLMNVVGMKPYIEGLVGQYSFGKNGEIDMDPDAVPVRYDGSPNDCEEAGKATFYFPSQMFPKEGIFKGFIGVKDDRDGSKNPQISGVTIWFKVLPGIAQMGHACDAYIDELDKALQNFKDRLDNHDKDYQSRLQKVIDDARNTYESETKNAHDSLDALKSQIQANRDEQANLAQHLAGTEQQIAIHDVVTRPEFLQLSQQISDRLAHMDLTPSYYNDQADMENKNPNGTPNLCITADTGHKWLYDYNTGTWTDLGNFEFADIKPELKDQATSISSDNLLKNADFISTDGWTGGTTQGQTADYQFEPDSYNGSKIIALHGFDGGESWWTSPLFDVKGHDAISIGALLKLRYSGSSIKHYTLLRVQFFDKDNQMLGVNDLNIVPTNDFNFWSLLNRNIPSQVAKCNVTIVIYGLGIVDICRPQANFGDVLVPYAQSTMIKAVNNENLLATSPVTSWYKNLTDQTNAIIQDDYQHTYLGKPTVNIDASSNEGVWNNIESPTIPLSLNDNAFLDLLIPLRSTSTNKGNAVVTIRELDDAENVVANYDQNMINANDIILREFRNIPLAPTATNIKILISVNGLANLNVGNAVLHLKKQFDGELSNLNAWGTNNVGKKGINQGSVVIDSTGNDLNTYSVISYAINIPKVSNYISIRIDNLTNYNVKMGHPLFTIREFDGNQKQVQSTDFTLPSSPNSKVTEFDNFRLTSATANIQLLFSYQGSGVIQINGLEINPTSIPTNEVINEIGNLIKTTNLLDGNPVSSWVYQKQSQNILYSINDQITADGQPTVRMDSQDTDLTKYNTLITNKINIQGYKYLSARIKARPIYDASKGNITLTIRQYSSDNKIVKNDDLVLDPARTVTTYTFNGIKVADNAETVQFMVSLNGTGAVDIGNFIIAKPTAKFESDKSLAELFAPKDDNVLPQLEIDARDDKISNEWFTAPFAYHDQDRSFKGYVQFAIQGNSSTHYVKKNLKLKFFNDQTCQNKLKWQPKAGWSKNNKFNLKANWIDATQSRNLVNAGLIKNAIANTPIANQQVAQSLLNTQSLGQMEGIPIELSFNNGYYGLMTLNTKKDEKVFGMDSHNPAHECITNDNWTQGFVPGQTFDVNNYGTEIHDAPSAELKTNLTAFINFINNSSDEDFKAQVGNYIDIYSVINTYLFGLMSEEWDFQDKSQLLLTWNNGKYYYMAPYDLDSTWGLYWDGSRLNSTDEDAYFAFKNDAKYVNMLGSNNLLARMVKLFKPEIQKQYQKLRNTVWRNDQILTAFKKFIDAIPTTAYEREETRWADKPSAKITDFAQIQQIVVTRGNAMDDFMAHFADLPQPTTPQAQPTEQNKDSDKQ